MQIPLSELSLLVEEHLLALGAAPDECAVVAEMCIDAELRQHRSHGVRLLKNIATEFGLGRDRRRPIARVRETPVSVVIDGGYHLSPYVHRLAVDAAIEKAQSSGIAVASVRSAGVSGALGYLVERIANSGQIGIALNSTPMVVVAPGVSDPVLGTNPLAIAVPRQGQSPIVLDMATSAIAFNEVMRLRATGGKLPADVALDSEGNATTDPHAAVGEDGRGRVLPFGGHRGYGLALMIELIVSAFVTGRTADMKRSEEVHEPDDFGAIYLVISPGVLGDPKSASNAVEHLLTKITEAGGRLPGESSKALRDSAIVAGMVTLDDNAIAVLGLSPPTKARPNDA